MENMINDVIYRGSFIGLITKLLKRMNITLFKKLIINREEYNS